MSAVTDPDPLAPLLTRNVGHREILLRQAGGALSAGAAGRLLGITRAAVDECWRTGTLLCVWEGGNWRYPACQFREGEVVPGPHRVIPARSLPWRTQP
ncbi:hypothetical protein [Microvirga massiliensis]|uniref:hypothetical protein n=1 Tax=Microvirga massiliensis TaxID=1033741 RepID=UPI0011CAB737|nr:hypothetical protein [Microvirga massiliensis]